MLVLYKLNSGYARRTPRSPTPGSMRGSTCRSIRLSRSGLGSTKWEVLVGVRNLFRDPNDPASVYDELLVVRPPKRVVGGFLVRF